MRLTPTAISTSHQPRLVPRESKAPGHRTTALRLSVKNLFTPSSSACRTIQRSRFPGRNGVGIRIRR